MQKKDRRSDLKSQLIAIGEEILEKQGIKALSLRGVAKAAGVSHMAPYRHFDDKETLLGAIAEKGFHALIDTLDHAISNQPDKKLHLHEIKMSYVNFSYDHPELYKLMFSTGIKDKSRFPGLSKAMGVALMRCKEAIISSKETGFKFDEDNLRYQALAVWAFVHGLSSLIIDNKISLPADSRREFIANILNHSTSI